MTNSELDHLISEACEEWNMNFHDDIPLIANIHSIVQWHYQTTRPTQANYLDFFVRLEATWAPERVRNTAVDELVQYVRQQHAH